MITVGSSKRIFSVLNKQNPLGTSIEPNSVYARLNIGTNVNCASPLSEQDLNCR